MNKELYNEIKKQETFYRGKDSLLRSTFNERKANGASNEELQTIVNEIKKVDSDYAEAHSDLIKYKEMNDELERLSGAQMSSKDDKDFKKKVSEFEKFAVKFLAFEKELADKYGVELEVEEELEPEIEEDEEEVVKPKGNKAIKIISALLAAGTLFTAGALVANHINKNNSADVQDEEDDKDKDTEDLEMGEYGTFKDASDNEQVNARAQYIFDEYYSEFADDLSASEQKECSVEAIANTIRVLNGELPLDNEGNAYYDANLVDEYGQTFVKVVCDLPSSPELDKVYHVPSHLFAIDGSESSEFLKPYDEDYSNIAEGRNAGDNVKTEEAIRSLATKMWRQWSLQGMYGEVSPYDLSPEDRTLAFLGSMAKFGQYPFEYSLNHKTATCIEACVDYNNQKSLGKLSASEIFVGVTSGEWDKVIAKAAGIEVDNKPDSIDFQKDLEDTLEFKYNELKQLTRK